MVAYDDSWHEYCRAVLRGGLLKSPKRLGGLGDLVPDPLGEPRSRSAEPLWNDEIAAVACASIAIFAMSGSTALATQLRDGPSLEAIADRFGEVLRIATDKGVWWLTPPSDPMRGLSFGVFDESVAIILGLEDEYAIWQDSYEAQVDLLGIDRD